MVFLLSGPSAEFRIGDGRTAFPSMDESRRVERGGKCPEGGGRVCVKVGTSILYAATLKRASGQKSICILLRSELWGLYQNPTIYCGL